MACHPSDQGLQLWPLNICHSAFFHTFFLGAPSGRKWAAPTPARSQEGATRVRIQQTVKWPVPRWVIDGLHPQALGTFTGPSPSKEARNVCLKDFTQLISSLQPQSEQLQAKPRDCLGSEIVNPGVSAPSCSSVVTSMLSKLHGTMVLPFIHVPCMSTALVSHII